MVYKLFLYTHLDIFNKIGMYIAAAYSDNKIVIHSRWIRAWIANRLYASLLFWARCSQRFLSCV